MIVSMPCWTGGSPGTARSPRDDRRVGPPAPWIPAPANGVTRSYQHLLSGSSGKFMGWPGGGQRPDDEPVDVAAGVPRRRGGGGHSSTALPP